MELRTYNFHVDFPADWTSDEVCSAVKLIWEQGLREAIGVLERDHQLLLSNPQVLALSSLYVVVDSPTFSD